MFVDTTIFSKTVDNDAAFARILYVFNAALNSESDPSPACNEKKEYLLQSFAFNRIDFARFRSGSAALASVGTGCGYEHNAVPKDRHTISAARKGADGRACAEFPGQQSHLQGPEFFADKE
ncbi:MAG TPA: hypothetical protein VNA17_07625 [Pyrinomonadaceae bacterium]|nr:hypothetical protein [Pyrinomonadaceae bacterium]